MEQAQHRACGACWVTDTSCPLCIGGPSPSSPFSILAGELEVGLIFSSVAWGQWEVLLGLLLGAGKTEGKPGLARRPSVRLSRLFYVPGGPDPLPPANPQPQLVLSPSASSQGVEIKWLGSLSLQRLQ